MRRLYRDEGRMIAWTRNWKEKRRDHWVSWVFHDSEHEDYCLLRSDAVKPSRKLSTFSYTWDANSWFLRNAGSFLAAHTVSQFWNKIIKLKLVLTQTYHINTCLVGPRRATENPGGRNPNPDITNSVALVRKRTIPTERQPLVCEVSANCCR
jgi:hypothetical protein